MATNQELKAAAIFGSYLTACGGLTILICRDVYKQYALRQARTPKAKQPTTIALGFFHGYTAFAGLCLSLTWYYMISFFALSYQVWALNHGVTQFNLQTASIWLKDVQLFRDAWEVALEQPGRLFWSQPIFFITAIWSLYVCRAARHRDIPHAWAYMLLGQIVAISFAQSLFFLAVIVFPKLPNTKSVQKGSSTFANIIADLVHLAVVILTIVPVAMIPDSTNTPKFLPVLLLPHIALMLPPILAAVSKSGADTDVRDRIRTRFTFGFLLLIGAILQLKVLAFALLDDVPDRHVHRHSQIYSIRPGPLSHLSADSTGWRSLINSFQSHPAVSSVGYDVLLSSISSIIWYVSAPGTI